jgi:apolipoprotein D and lipocalin family protein
MFLLFLLATSVAAEFNRTQYLGRWYQVYSDLFVDATFENSSYCDTADYGLYPNNTISVWNRERQYSVDGPERQIFGWAEETNTSGQLVVHLQTTDFPAPYWIYQLGPVKNDQYEYSVVSDPFKLTLFVLARNVTEFQDLYNENVTHYLTEQGFTTFINAPIPTQQEGCVYENVI